MSNQKNPNGTKRHHIWISNEEWQKVSRVAKLTHKKKSEIVRHAIRKLGDPLEVFKEKRKRHIAKANWYLDQIKVLEEQKKAKEGR